MAKQYYGITPAYPDQEPWCSRCGATFGEFDSFHWVEPQNFTTLSQSQPHYPDAAGFYVVICDQCFISELPPLPFDKTITPYCGYCDQATSFDVCKWVPIERLEPAASKNRLTCDTTGNLLVVCPTCYQENIDHFLGLND